MGYFGNIVTVTCADLTRSDGGEAVMSRNNYDQLVNRNRITVVVRGGGLGREAEVDWATLPDRFKQKYIAKYGDPEEEAVRRNSMIRFDEGARRFFADYILPDGTRLKEDKQQEYMINASVLNHLIEMEDKQRRLHPQKGNHTPVAWDNIAAECSDLRDTYCHTLPASESRLRDKVREYRRDGYACLVSGKLGNGNTTKITPAAGEWIIAHKTSVNPVYTTRQLFERFNAVAPAKGWKTLKSQNTLIQFLERPEVKPRWYHVEQGSQRANNLFMRQNRTLLPTCRDALWYVDGTKLNIFYKIFDPASRKLKAATTNCIYVLDAYSEVFVGYHVCAQETFRTTYEAVRNAAENVGFLPFELVSDNQSGFTSGAAKRWQSKLGTVCHTTTPYNGKSKTVESAFGRFQAEVLHKLINYTGGNITARSDKARIDERMIIENKESLPTYAEMCGIHDACVEEWNNAPHPVFKDKSRWEVYRESANDCAIRLDETVREDVFYISTENESTFTARGIEITIDGVKHAYEPFTADGRPDLEWRRDNTGRQFIVEYDPHDTSRVRLCTLDKKYGLQFNTWALPYMTIHRAIQDQEVGERTRIIAALDANKEEIVRRDIETRRLQMAYGVGPESVGYKAPRPQGVSEQEYLRIADRIESREHASALPDNAAEVLEDSLGQVQKGHSSFDVVAALDRL